MMSIFDRYNLKNLFQKPKHCLDPILSSESSFSTETGMVYKVLRYVDKGRRGAVYKIEDASGVAFALKVAVSLERKTIRSIRNDLAKSNTLSKYQVAHAKVLYLGGNYVIKEWAEGVRFDQWRLKWEATGFPDNPREPALLFEDLRAYAKMGLYISDFSPKNIIFNGDRWVIIDTGPIKESRGEAELLSIYREKLSNWSIKASNAYKKKIEKYWHW